ncbi:hypothetical protein DFH08DRAFT_811502 [Mycena albidolilacea]|uniref:Uncharacterized protein n=1 Tax=Mycena albidolilacea TaxID=1033008 RepID=A0AAD7EPU4_9AGAR|nr:hypothetical protein DFH08DRAFT_811502 [Mycena albidolilacea]
MAVAGGCGVACGVAWLVLAYTGPSHYTCLSSSLFLYSFHRQKTMWRIVSIHLDVHCMVSENQDSPMMNHEVPRFKLSSFNSVHAQHDPRMLQCLSIVTMSLTRCPSLLTPESFVVGTRNMKQPAEKYSKRLQKQLSYQRAVERLLSPVHQFSAAVVVASHIPAPFDGIRRNGPCPAQFDAIRQNGLCTPFGGRRAWGRSSVEWGIPMVSGEIHARQTQAILSAEWLVIT